MHVPSVGALRRAVRAFRATWRTLLILILLPAMPLLAVPGPGQLPTQRLYCRFMLRCLGVRVAKSGGPIRNLPGVLVVSPHMSWVDVLVIGSLLPGAFVARADLVNWPALGQMARLLRVIPIDRLSLRRLPEVVHIVAQRLREGHNVVAFPEGSTWCGLAYGPFKPAMFQAAIDAGRPVQPLRLSYHHRDGTLSTVPAYIGDDTLAQSFRRLVTTRLTVAHVRIEALQLPGEDRRDLSRRCEAAVRATATTRHGAHVGAGAHERESSATGRDPQLAA